MRGVNVAELIDIDLNSLDAIVEDRFRQGEARCYKLDFEKAMDDDFNTPVALSVLFDLARELNKAKETDHESTKVFAFTLKKLASLLGILQEDPEDFLKSSVLEDEALTNETIEQSIQTRLDAKKTKNWVLADKIRDDLKGQGVILEDSPSGQTTWRRE